MTPELISAIVAVLMGIGSICGAVASWIKSRTDIASIKADRQTTKNERDADSQVLHDKVLKLEFENTSLKDRLSLAETRITDGDKQIAVINTELARMSTKMDNILDAIRELKESK